MNKRKFILVFRVAHTHCITCQTKLNFWITYVEMVAIESCVRTHIVYYVVVVVDYG